MSNKKYYWLKLKEDFFEEDTIEWLEEQENGIYYSNFYLKLCVRALRGNGILIRKVGDILIPYDVKKLSEITRVKVDTVIVAMELFKKIGLVKILENGEIYLTQLENMVGSETSKAQLMRNKRARDKKNEINEGNNVTKELPDTEHELPKCYTEKDKEIEKDKEKETEVDKDLEKNYRKHKDIKNKEKKVCGGVSVNKSKMSLEEKCIDENINNASNTTDSKNTKDLICEDLNNDSKDYTDYGQEYGNKIKVFKHFEKCGFVVTRQLMDYIAEDISTYGEEWVIEAANECVARNKGDNYGYLTGILQKWSARGKIERSFKESRANDSAYDPMKSILD